MLWVPYLTLRCETLLAWVAHHHIPTGKDKGKNTVVRAWAVEEDFTQSESSDTDDDPRRNVDSDDGM